MAERVGIRTVAEAAGVSMTTVSHALSGGGQMAAETRERVRRVATELGYSPNRIARALRSRRSGVIGFVSDEIATTPFAGSIVLGAQEEAARRGLLLMVVNSNRDEGVEERQISALLDQQVDAVVYATMYHRRVTVPAALRQTPTVLVDAFDPDAAPPSIVPDEVRIGREATRLLLDAGHTRIAHLSIEDEGPGADGRLSGYGESMRNAGLEPLVVRVPGDARAETGRAAFRRALDCDPGLTAVFSFNDLMAMGVYQVAADRGWSIPRDLSVVGVDNFELVAAELRPGLTTFALPHYDMGRWAIDQVVALLEDPTSGAGRSTLPCPVVVRGSVGAPRTAGPPRV